MIHPAFLRRLAGGGWGGGVGRVVKVLLSQALDLSVSRGRPCFHTRATSERSGHRRGRTGGSPLVVSEPMESSMSA